MYVVMEIVVAEANAVIDMYMQAHTQPWTVEVFQCQCQCRKKL